MTTDESQSQMDADVSGERRAMHRHPPITQQLATDVDKYITTHLPHDDAVLSAALASSEAAGLPNIAVSTTQGKFLNLLMQIKSPLTIVEYGTLGAYSTIWLARGLRDDPRARIWSLEIDEEHARVARTNLKQAGLEHKATVVIGDAEETAARLIQDGTFHEVDVWFIDADKERCSTYVAQALSASKAGSVIIVDNVIRRGAVIQADGRDTRVQGVRKTFDYLGSLEREGFLQSTALQTVGDKSYDGFTFSVVQKSKPFAKPP